MPCFFSEPQEIALSSDPLDRLLLYPQHFIQQSSRWYDHLYANVAWRQDFMNIAGSRKAVPRLQAWYGEPSAYYSYSGVSLKPCKFDTVLRDPSRAYESLYLTRPVFWPVDNFQGAGLNAAPPC